MSDVSIRNVPDEVLNAIDGRARRLGISRNEYLRRTLARELRPSPNVTAADLPGIADRFSDLADPDVMRDAWA